MAFYLAAVLIILIGVAHSWLGERYILSRLFRRDNLPELFGSTKFTTRTLRFTWHLTSVAWLGFATILFLLAQPVARPEVAVARIIAAVFLVHFAVALIASRGKHLSWVVFLAITALVIYGARL